MESMAILYNKLKVQTNKKELIKELEDLYLLGISAWCVEDVAYTESTIFQMSHFLFVRNGFVLPTTIQ